MPKRRVAVVMTVPEPWATEIDGLRRALGDSQMRRIAPHLTMVPPINVDGEELGEVVQILRAAASSRTAALDLTIGPVASFAPANPVLYLAAEPADEIGAVHAACLVGRLERPEKRPFVPHVTIDINRPDGEHPGAMALLADYRVECRIERLDLMELRMSDGHERWSPIADADFGGETVVDAGALRVVLTTSTLVDPVTATTLGVDPTSLLGSGAGDGLVITARDEHAQVLGVAAGRRRGRTASVMRTVFVVEQARGQGVARRLVEAWERAATGGGAVRAVAPGVSRTEAGLLGHLGWNASEPVLDRRFA